jgi:hypothetical protein
MNREIDALPIFEQSANRFLFRFGFGLFAFSALFVALALQWGYPFVTYLARRCVPFTGFSEAGGGVGAARKPLSRAVDLVAINELDALVFGRVGSPDSCVETATVGEVDILLRPGFAARRSASVNSRSAMFPSYVTPYVTH